MGFPQHPDGKRELEVRVGDCAGFVEDTFDSFLGPGPILEWSIQEKNKRFTSRDSLVVAWTLRALHPFQSAQDQGNLHT